MILIPAYLPPISYFKSFITKSEISLLCQASYRKQTFRNRCVICSANGRLKLTIPIAKDKIKQNVKHVMIHNAMPWQNNHWKSIETAYNSSPFFEHYKDDIKPFFIEEQKFLYDFNFKLIVQILNMLDVNIKVKEVNNINNLPEIENMLNPKKDFTKSVPYHQVFQNKNGFQSDLSIIDLLFNLGPESSSYIKNL
jgi:hypothetical protein